MVNTYFESIPVREEREAKILGSDSGWSILNLLRESGSEGCTAEEISSNLDLPISTVYNVLNSLRAVGFIHTKRIPKQIGRPSKDSMEQEMRTGKQKRIYIEKVPWGNFTFTHDFDRLLVEEIDKLIDKSEISEACASVIDQIISKMKNNSSCKGFLPSTEDCPHCHYSHEAREYAFALVQAVSDRIMKSELLQVVLEKHGYYF
jgi:DNA-binding transcriptional ArsR family regulator